MVQAKKATLPAHSIREVAVAADADPRTVIKLLAGKSVQPLARRRIERALRKLGLADAVDTEAEP